ncbi:putative glycoside hydrolase [Tepidibacillus decaturensis]|uniref:DUF4015 domain-containing protein n=1 Tax=Tepidibacillus decaturensis TaxID=1413211 RepID=A0A135L5W8_9BACI|nr:putative glycoside hydrolase [Tepidibacillus decaturensis]KXG44372.1 hypothetical protein U473_10395 [Tepidibacillus decaturensis]
MKKLTKTKTTICLLFLSIIFILTSCSPSNLSSSFISDKKDVGKQVTSKEQGNTNQEQTTKDENDQNNGTDQSENIDQPTTPEPTKPAFTFEYPDAVRGIYVTAHSTGSSRFPSLLSLIDKTELNTMVIDIKDDYGNITFKPDHPAFEPYSKTIIKDPKQLIKTLEEHKIYPIARIVVFKDSTLAKMKPELSFIDNGSVWKNGRGESFVNPFLKEVWKHNVEIAKMAVELGFQEIQFDYVRFPEGFEKRDKTLTYSMGEYKGRKPTKFIEIEKNYQKQLEDYNQKLEELQAGYDQLVEEQNQLKTTQATETEIKKLDEMITIKEQELKELQSKKPIGPVFTDRERATQLRVDAVTDFVTYAKKELEPYNVKVSVDIFGYSATLPEAPGIGQNFSKISSNVDVISSMIYPSHWGPGYFGISKPDLYPYQLVTEYTKKENEVLGKLGDKKPVSRPWIQDFTASWLGKGNYKSYGKKEIEEQIKALKDNGINEFLIWNASNKYTPNVDYTP